MSKLGTGADDGFQGRAFDCKLRPGDLSIDAFHDGAFEVAQPASGGHRAGLDALLLAACLPETLSGLLADLGAGCGVAGLAALNINPGLDLVSVELNSTMFERLKQTLELPANTAFRNRVRALQGDVTKTGSARMKEGLEDNSFDHVMMNPPYNSASMRAPGDAVKTEAFMLAEGGIDAWFRTATAILKPGGTFSMIYRSENIGTVIACSQGRFGDMKIMPVHSRAEEPAKRVLIHGIRGSRGPLSIMPGFAVHRENGTFTSKADAIFKGRGRLAF